MKKRPGTIIVSRETPNVKIGEYVWGEIKDISHPELEPMKFEGKILEIFWNKIRDGWYATIQRGSLHDYDKIDMPLSGENLEVTIMTA